MPAVSTSNYDFCGWATRSNIRCSDGRTILDDAFKENDNTIVPLIFRHNHDDLSDILGQALLHNKKGGVYTYCLFNNTPEGQRAKELVQHGDLTALSINANQLTHTPKKEVTHGVIREVSLVLAGANPGAYIEDVNMSHEDGGEYDAIIYCGGTIDDEDEFSHEDEFDDDEEKDLSHEDKDAKEDDSDDEEEANPIEDFMGEINGLTDSQRDAVMAIVGYTLVNANSLKKKLGLKEGNPDNKETSKEEDKEVGLKHNAFDRNEENNVQVLSHEDEVGIINLAKNAAIGTLKNAISTYTSDELQHGIEDIEALFPDYKDVTPMPPETFENDRTWVDGILAGVHKTPFQRIRTRFLDARDESNRAHGYKKGDLKQPEGNLELLTRTTDPQTIYVVDDLDRDDMIDITDFSVVDYKWKYMEHRLKDEIARAILIGDGRTIGDKFKIKEDKIRPIWTDDDLFTIHYTVDVATARQTIQGTEGSKYFSENYIMAEALVQAALYSREQYKGSGNLRFYCTPHLLNTVLLSRDINGRRIYNSKSDVAAALDVSSIETIEQFENKIRTDSNGGRHKLLGMLLNLNDYSVGSVRGGQITKFDDFDIDFNRYKYLIETRMSGALTTPWSAIVLEEDVQ